MIRTNVTRAVVSMLAVLSVLMIFSGCASSGKQPPSQTDSIADYDPFTANDMPGEEYYIRRGDGLSIRFLYNANLNMDNLRVRQDGKISLPIIGDCDAADLTVPEFTENVRRTYLDHSAKLDLGQRVHAGDEIQIRFTYNPQLNQRIIVRPDGKVSLLKLGEVLIENMTFSEFEKKVKEGYSTYIKDPEISVILLSTVSTRIYAGEGEITILVTDPQPREIYVGGEVGEPKLIQVRDWMTPIQALAAAGGIKPSGDGGRVIYITRGNSGEAIITKLNLDAYRSAGKSLKNLYLRNGDVLLVPRTGIAKLNLAMQQYIRDAMPLSTSLSFSYLLNEDRYR